MHYSHQRLIQRRKKITCDLNSQTHIKRPNARWGFECGTVTIYLWAPLGAYNEELALRACVCVSPRVGGYEGSLHQRKALEVKSQDSRPMTLVT